MTWDEADALWREDEAANGWVLARVAAWYLRLPGVRFLRYMWHAMRADSAASQWNRVGIGFGGVGQYDRWVLYAIRRGWA